MCREFGILYDPADKNEDRVALLSSEYQALELQQQTTGLVHWLVVDELTPATGTSESDWRGLKTGTINTVLCLQPTSYNGSSTVLPPTSLTILQFSRVYRCTQAILAWVSYVTLELEKIGEYNTSFPLAQACPGHEVPGQLPETLVLPQCSCTSYSCTSLVSRLSTETQWGSRRQDRGVVQEEEQEHRGKTRVSGSWPGTSWPGQACTRGKLVFQRPCFTFPISRVT